MNDRYTSPETSRALAEAGIDQMHENFEDVRAQWFDYGGGLRLVPGYAGGAGHRALDLTDILAEMTRPRPEEKDARPLIEKVYVLTQDSGRSWNCIGVRPDEEVIDHDVEINGDAGEPPVEAAALVLLALLRERRKP